MMATDAEITGPINVGNPNEISIKELADVVTAMCDSSAPLAKKPMPKDDPQQRQPDTSLARELLKWEPTPPLKQGLQHTIDWFSRKTAG